MAKLEAKQIARQAALIATPGEWTIRVVIDVANATITDLVTLEAVTQRLGGVRWWWRCTGCSTHRQVLYVAPWGLGVRCRRCLGLCYPSQRMDKLERLTTRVLNAADRLGALDPYDVFIAGDLPERPRGMHRRKYDELVNGLTRTLSSRNAVYVAKALALSNGSRKRIRGLEFVAETYWSTSPHCGCFPDS
jgi:hypothetical protein